MDIRLVIFDFDGTLADTRQIIVSTMQRTMRELALPVADEAACAATIGLPLKECFRQIYPQQTETELDNCAETYRRLFFASAQNLTPELFPHVRETLEALHAKGVRMAIASSRSSVSLHNFIDKMGMRDLIEMMVGADEVTRHKPDPESVNVILSALGVPAASALVVGDMPVDVAMGNAAGAFTCAVTYGNATADELSDADFLLDNMSDLCEILFAAAPEKM